MTDFVSKFDLDSVARAAFADATTRNLIVDQLIRRRIELGLTQTDVAERIGRKQTTVSEFEKEGSNPRLATVLRYARAVKAQLVWKVLPKEDE